MILIRTMRQFRTGGTIPSFRACQSLSYLDLSKSDRGSFPLRRYKTSMMRTTDCATDDSVIGLL
jgi:hypothetical protein